jgi:hypothetical protein
MDELLIVLTLYIIKMTFLPLFIVFVYPNEDIAF